MIQMPRERLSPAESSLAEDIMKCIRELVRGRRMVWWNRQDSMLTRATHVTCFE